MISSTVTAAAAAAAVGLALATAAPMAASAHVSIDPGVAEPGSYLVVDLKVPSESETAVTNRIELTLPGDTPFRSVRYVPLPGWDTELVTETLPEPVAVGETTITEAVTKIIFTAQAGFEIGNGQLQIFPLSLGPVPDTGSIVFGADQFYSDGTVVSWREVAGSDGDEPEFPAPVLFVTDAPPADHHGGAASNNDEEADSHSDDEMISASTTSSDDDVARGLGIGGLVLGAVALVLAILTRRRAVKA